MSNNGIQMTPDGFDPNGDETRKEPTVNVDAELMKILSKDIVFNEMMTRSDLLSKFFDPRRNINRECGYPDVIRPRDFQSAFDRNGLANRVVTFEPKECWGVQPEVYEDEDENNVTPFEEDWKALDKFLNPTGLGENFIKDPDGKMSPIWYFLRKVDILSRIGAYGVIFFGLNDLAGFDNEGNTTIDYSLPVKGYEEKNSMPADLQPDRYDPAKPKGKGKNKKEEQLGKSKKEKNDRINNLTANWKRTPDTIYSLTINEEEVKESGMKLLYLRAYPEYLAQVVRWESNPTSPRYGMPVMYLLTLNDPSQVTSYSGVGMDKSCIYVHWTRCLHIAEADESSNEALAVPALQNVFDDVYNALKIKSASGEGYYKAAFSILSLETNPQLGGDVEVDETAAKRTLENVLNGFQRAMLNKGLTLKSVAPTISDPTPHIDMVVRLICIAKGWPKRKFEGSERGELSSAQDEVDFIRRMMNRQNYYVTPRIIGPFINTCINFGILRPPGEEGVAVAWPDMFIESKLQRAERFLTKVQAYSAATGGNVSSVFTPKDILTKLDGDFTNAEATAILEASAEELLKQQEEQMAMEQEQMAAMADAGYVDPEDVEAGLTPEAAMQGKQLEAEIQPPKAPTVKPPVTKPPVKTKGAK